VRPGERPTVRPHEPDRDGARRDGYRDRGDEYITKVFEMTEDLDAIHGHLKGFQAAGASYAWNNAAAPVLKLFETRGSQG
jgi:hypothetical protein